MQVNRTGIGLIAFFLIAGLLIMIVPFFIPGGAVASFVTLPLGGIWAAVAIGLWIYARRQKEKGEHEQWVFQNGLRGRATVVDISSHAMVNEMPVIRLEVDLEVPGQEPRRAEKRIIMSVFAAHRMKEGLVLPAVVNPGDPSDFVLVW